MNEAIDGTVPVFDQLEEDGEAWNVYQYMTKLGSQAIGKLVLDMDFQHFSDKHAPMHKFVGVLAEALALNKKITSRGDWYAKLPFGDPQKLRELKAYEDAALAAANFIDYCVRATDSNGEKLPKEQLPLSVLVAAGAGFLTTATLLSWLIYGFCAYPGMQERLVQELVDNDFTEGTVITAELTEKLIFQEHCIKEMQRVHNPSYQPGRTARIDCILPGGYKIHEGDVVIAALHHIHYNPQDWENPGRFDPDRWAKDPIKHKAQYMPFAIGPRMCIGFNFALQEAKVFLPKLVWRYRWQREGESAVEHDPFFRLIRPVNFYVKTERRTEWPSKSASRQC